jgi:periplasmic divalent cation tolerance protein
MRIIVFVTASNKEEASRIAEGLIRDKLAACVNITAPIESVFWWDSKIDHASEVLLIIKSIGSKLPAIIKKVKALHSYEVPEIVALPIAGGSKDYLKWMDTSLKG